MEYTYRGNFLVVTDQTEPGSVTLCDFTCWVPDWLPVQVAIFFSDPSTESVVKIAAVYENAWKEAVRETR